MSVAGDTIEEAEASMSEQEKDWSVVDPNAVIERLKKRFASRTADYEHESAMLNAGLEQCIQKIEDLENKLAEVLADNERLRNHAVEAAAGVNNTQRE